MSQNGQVRSETTTSAKWKEGNGVGERKRRPMTPAEEQALKLERLLAHPDKAIVIPSAPNEGKTLRAPREMMKNVSGSSAGAGSGEFHIYKHSRRREGERVKLMEDAAQKEREALQFAERQRSQAEELALKTDKNRSKRDKKKLAKAAAKAAQRANGNAESHEGLEKDTKSTQAKRQSDRESSSSEANKRRKGEESILIEDNDV